jgi:hypothetical protein
MSSLDAHRLQKELGALNELAESVRRRKASWVLSEESPAAHAQPASCRVSLPPRVARPTSPETIPNEHKPRISRSYSTSMVSTGSWRRSSIFTSFSFRTGDSSIPFAGSFATRHGASDLESSEVLEVIVTALQGSLHESPFGGILMRDYRTHKKVWYIALFFGGTGGKSADLSIFHLTQEYSSIAGVQHQCKVYGTQVWPDAQLWDGHNQQQCAAGISSIEWQHMLTFDHPSMRSLLVPGEVLALCLVFCRANSHVLTWSAFLLQSQCHRLGGRRACGRGCHLSQ